MSGYAGDDYDYLGAYHHDRMAQDLPEHHEVGGPENCATCIQERTAGEMDKSHGKRNLSLSQFANFFKR